MQGIYEIRQLTTGFCYVGSAVNIKRRWAQHRSAIKRGTHTARRLMHAFQKYGSDAFTFEVLEECDISDESIRIERENYWIQRLKPVFNVAPVAGSILGMKQSVETKAKISAALMGHACSPERNAKISASNMGRVISAESRAKSSAKLKGRPLSAEHIANRTAAQRGIPKSAETRIRMSAAQKGRIISPEHRAKISASRTPEFRAMVSRVQKGRVKSPEEIEKIRIGKLAHSMRDKEAQALLM
jgi:group I intron endonuclease